MECLACCGGKIQLVASVTRMSGRDTLMELKDESGRTWRAMSGEGPNKAEDSIPLQTLAFRPPRPRSGSARRQEVKMRRPPPNARNAGKTGAAVLRVQSIDDSGEALGVWEAFHSKGSFGAMRTGKVPSRGRLAQSTAETAPP